MTVAVGYTRMLRQPVARRLVTAKAVSELGDYLGLAALLLLAFGKSHSVLGPIGVYAARSLPALAVATVFPGWLDRLPRRGALVSLALLGAVVITVPAVDERTVTAIGAATVLGAVRAAYLSVHTAVVAEAVEQPLRLPLFGLTGLLNQVAQVVGVLTGSALSVFVDPRWALLADAVSFLVAAGIFSGLPAMAALPRDGRPLAYQGIRVIAGQRVLRVVALLTWATFLSSGLPEALAPAVAPRTWIPYVMAGAATGGVIFAYLVARRAFLANVVNQVRTAAACAGALLFGGAAMLIHAPPWTILAANIAIGAASGWIIGAQATFAQLTPAGRMGQVEATMVATNIFVQGAGILGLGWLVTITHRPGLAYLAAGTTIAVVASYASAQFNNLQSAPAPSS